MPHARLQFGIRDSLLATALFSMGIGADIHFQQRGLPLIGFLIAAASFGGCYGVLVHRFFRGMLLGLAAIAILLLHDMLSTQPPTTRHLVGVGIGVVVLLALLRSVITERTVICKWPVADFRDGVAGYVARDSVAEEAPSALNSNNLQASVTNYEARKHALRLHERI